MIRRSDLLLLAGILIAGIALFALNEALQEPGAKVRVISGRDVYGVYELENDIEVKIDVDDAVNIIVISNGTVEMRYANCPGGDCVRQHAISMAGQSIVCLPNKIIVTIEGGGYKLDSRVY